jgi:Lysophospholipase
MAKKEELYFDSRDGVNKIHAVKWIPDRDKPVCILQVIHGMAEYIERYEEFAQVMAEKGILVTGEDHLGHGKSVGENGTYGYFCERDAATVVVRDSHRLKKMVQEQYPGVPYFILGHSMGSFILRNYLCRYGTGIHAAVIVGTGMQPKPLLMMGKAVAAVQKVFTGSKHPSGLLNALSFGSYNKRIPNEKTMMDWLTKDEKIVDAYLEDPLCGFTFTVNGFQTLLELVSRLYKRENLEKMPKELPVLFVAGEADPVGDYGKGVKRAYRSFIDAGMKNVKMKLYENDRHELLNEMDREQVYEDIYQWMSSVL